MVMTMDVSTFLMDTPFVKGRPGRGSLWEFYQEYHILKDCDSVLILVYEDLVKNMGDGIRMIGKFMGLTMSEDQVEKVLSMSSKAYMAQHNTLFDEPYERAKQLGRAGDLSQLAPGNKVATQEHPQKLNEAAQEFLTARWNESMAPLGYDNYGDFAASIRERNRTRFC